MKRIIFLFVCVVICDKLANAVDLQCYQCDRTTEECEDNKASIVKCGNPLTTRCSRQVKKDSADKTRAIRKCVIPDKFGNVNCPAGYECFNCNENLCNANPVVTITTPSTTSIQQNTAAVAKFAWSSLVAVIFNAVYL